MINIEKANLIPTFLFCPSLQKLVCKSDQLVKRRAKSGLITVNSSWDEVKAFVNKFINKEFTVGGTTGILKTFIITPFIPHQQVGHNFALLSQNPPLEKGLKKRYSTFTYYWDLSLLNVTSVEKN